jgi:hypothetical protein
MFDVEDMDKAGMTSPDAGILPRHAVFCEGAYAVWDFWGDQTWSLIEKDVCGWVDLGPLSRRAMAAVRAHYGVSPEKVNDRDVEGMPPDRLVALASAPLTVCQ